MAEEAREYLFTFGFGHVHPDTGQSMANRYVRLHGTTDSTRAEMRARFGTSWAFQYKTAEEAGVAKHGLRPFYLDDEDRSAAVLAVRENIARSAVEEFARSAFGAASVGQAVLISFRLSRLRDGTFQVDEIQVQ